MSDDNGDLPPYKWAGGRVECPACERTDYTEHRANLCACGRWFAVDPPDPETIVPTEATPDTRVIDHPREVLWSDGEGGEAA